MDSPEFNVRSMVRIRIRRVVRYDDGCFCVVALLLVSSLSSVLLFQSFGEVQEEGKEAKRSQKKPKQPSRSRQAR